MKMSTVNRLYVPVLRPVPLFRVLARR